MADYSGQVKKAYQKIKEKGTIVAFFKINDIDSSFYSNDDDSENFPIDEDLLKENLSSVATNNDLFPGYDFFTNYAVFLSQNKSFPGGETRVDFSFMIPALNCSFLPEEGVKIYFNGSFYEIVNNDVLSPGGEDIMYTVNVKK